MNKYSRQLRIGRVFVRRTSSGRKYAILADFTQCLVTQRFTLFCRLLSPFLRCRTGFFALRKSPFHNTRRHLQHARRAFSALQESLFHTHEQASCDYILFKMADNQCIMLTCQKPCILRRTGFCKPPRKSQRLHVVRIFVSSLPYHVIMSMSFKS